MPVRCIPTMTHKRICNICNNINYERNMLNVRKESQVRPGEERGLHHHQVTRGTCENIFMSLWITTVSILYTISLSDSIAATLSHECSIFVLIIQHRRPFWPPNGRENSAVEKQKLRTNGN